MRLLSGKIEDGMKYLGFYQLGGGILGLLFTLNLLAHEGPLSGLGFLFYAFALGLFGFSIYCGNLLRKGNTKGLTLSVYNQILQILNFSISAVSYLYYSGIGFSIGFQWTNKFMPDFFLWYSTWHFRITQDDLDHLSLYINIIPLLIIYYIWKIENQIDERKELIESAEKLNQGQNNG